ncbi:MAG: hypothetical protein ACRELB_14500 [Polyangiaceae bacterium]
MTMRTWARGLVVVALAVLQGGCKGCHDGAGAGDAGPTSAGSAIGDAAPATAGSAGLVDGAPPDDSIPATSSDELTARARHLLEAIAKDDPDLAADILFPRDGWLATRDAADPGKEWERHVATPFRRAVHADGRHHDGLDGAQLVSFELGHAIVQATPKKHGWKNPLWIVHGSRLTYLVDGHTRTFGVREMTAWRGAWYVTRLR